MHSWAKKCRQPRWEAQYLGRKVDAEVGAEVRAEEGGAPRRWRGGAGWGAGMAAGARIHLIPVGANREHHVSGPGPRPNRTG